MGEKFIAFEECIPLVSGAPIVITAVCGYFSEPSKREVAEMARERQRANLKRRYGTYTPPSIRDYWFPPIMV